MPNDGDPVPELGADAMQDNNNNGEREWYKDYDVHQNKLMTSLMKIKFQRNFRSSRHFMHNQ